LVYKGVPVLDLDYEEDSNAETDMNVVMDETGKFIEIQGTAEGKTFSMDEMLAMTELARNGIAEIITQQKHALAADI
jgi:ribonuclease PH